jgi:hypothetical protein
MRFGTEGILEFLGKLEKHLPNVASRNPLVSLGDLKEFAKSAEGRSIRKGGRGISYNGDVGLRR